MVVRNYLPNNFSSKSTMWIACMILFEFMQGLHSLHLSKSSLSISIILSFSYITPTSLIFSSLSASNWQIILAIWASMASSLNSKTHYTTNDTPQTHHNQQTTSFPHHKGFQKYSPYRHNSINNIPHMLEKWRA